MTAEPSNFVKRTVIYDNIHRPTIVRDAKTRNRLPATLKRVARVILLFWLSLGNTPAQNEKDKVDFWAYQAPEKTVPPHTNDEQWAHNEIDSFILANLESKGVRPGSDADKTTLIRRVFYDLIGLPPTPKDIDQFLTDNRQHAFRLLVDRLLASPQFGERWGRHWLDVVRFAESVTLRGLVFSEAWRYRDYVVNAFNNDLPYDEFIQEQIAGDLMPSSSVAEKQNRLIATTFLTLGNTNLEDQDKAQLRMDVVDEQLDTIGKTFMGQTFGCARCHDHKFDPIPTRDYYALAGILRNTVTLIDANVSNWIEVPLPLEPDQEKRLQAHEAAVTRLKSEIKTLKATVTSLSDSSPQSGTSAKTSPIRVQDLQGLILDDAQAARVGEWKYSQHTKSYVGNGYLHDLNSGKGQKMVTFHPAIRESGQYEVRLAFTPGSNRADNVPVTIVTADSKKVIHVNQQETPPILGRFISLGLHRFEQNDKSSVQISNQGTMGHVIADAVQFLPLEVLTKSEKNAGSVPIREITATTSEKLKIARKNLADLESKLKELNSSGPKRPMVMSVKEDESIRDIHVHIRGNVHSLGKPVPRGVLKVATHGTPPRIPKSESGRLQLGEWLSSRSNPLTARIMANRVWHWLLGSGIVRTPDHFGSMGENPSHPELLDFLAVGFMENDWSVKHLIREIVLSRTYQLSSETSSSGETNTPELSTISDPENRLFGRMNRRRLEAECIRDTILFVSGALEFNMGGNTIEAGTKADYGYADTHSRRSIYVPVFRNALPELFDVFDFANPSMVTGRRNVSTVAPQALFLLNHPFVMEQARRTADRFLTEPEINDHARIIEVYRSVLGRFPSGKEHEQAEIFLNGSEVNSHGKRAEVWAQFVQALLASIDFRYLN